MNYSLGKLHWNEFHKFGLSLVNMDVFFDKLEKALILQQKCVTSLIADFEIVNEIWILGLVTHMEIPFNQKFASIVMLILRSCFRLQMGILAVKVPWFNVWTKVLFDTEGQVSRILVFKTEVVKADRPFRVTIPYFHEVLLIFLYWLARYTASICFSQTSVLIFRYVIDQTAVEHKFLCEFKSHVLGLMRK